MMKFDSELTEKLWHYAQEEGVVAQEQLTSGLHILVGEIDHLIPDAQYVILTVHDGTCVADFYDDMEEAFSEWSALTNYEEEMDE